MKVLHVFSKLDKGGAELRTVSLGEELKKHGISFDYLCISGEKGELDHSLIEQGSKITYLKLKDKFFFRDLNTLLKNEKYDVVHSHVLYVSGLIQLFAKRNNVPVRVTHFRSTGSGKIKSMFKKNIDDILLKILISYSTDIICVSESVKKAIFKNKRNQKVKVIYNGFPESTIYKSVSNIPSEKSKKIIHIGRMIPDKNHIKVLEVFNEIYKYDNEYTLLFVGQIHHKIKSNLDEYISKHSLENCVKFLGVRKDIPRLLSLSSLMIFPSKREGLPGSVIEALLNGVPVIGSDIPSLKELEVYSNKLVCLNNDLGSGDEWKECSIKMLEVSCDEKSDDLLENLEMSPFSMQKNVEGILSVYKI